ncbi:hypothetical protein A4G20_09995 [Pasteurellaceae bacterium RH1A]|nr:hypothetical protein A4G20_09995 [Pasteurellaceae bacterium RH1A]
MMSKEDTTAAIFGIPLSVIWLVAPFYAAYKDFQNGDYFLALLDYAIAPLGIIRSLMFMFGD